MQSVHSGDARRNSSPRFFRNRVVRCGWVTTRRSDGARKSIAVFRRQVVPISTMEVRQ